MKSHLIYLLASALLLLSCKSPEPLIDSVEIGPSPRIVTGKVTKTITAVDQSDSATFVINYSYFSKQFSSNVMDSSYKSEVNKMIYRAAMFETAGEPQEGVEEVSDYFFQSRLDTLAKFYYEEQEGDEYGTLWDLEANFTIHDYLSFVELVASGYSYMGGAHGNGYLLYDWFDRKTGKLIGLEDVFTDLEAVNEIAEPHFRALFNLTAEESLNDYGFWFEHDKFTVNENFTLDGAYMVFYYNTYEIAPYAGGPTELKVPVKELMPFLKLKL